ncbi:hypothetical protein AVEN_154594-1 [Araneus ventricosus]|uniref:Uncharacterized protein n=1 Tax=Araneus ventricosus TaxID=182803 RepID=A0A4Y2FS36_ARAVE|nr:hypothetical protein AVEN_154594-1 [Araneus ventricosus]
MIEQFKDSHSFSTLFARFSLAFQFENESFREFGDVEKNIKSKVMIMNPMTFPEAIQLDERIEKTLQIITPNVNAAATNHQNPSDLAQLIKTTTEGYAKSLELVSQQLQALNVQMTK